MFWTSTKFSLSSPPSLTPAICSTRYFSSLEEFRSEYALKTREDYLRR